MSNKSAVLGKRTVVRASTKRPSQSQYKNKGVSSYKGLLKYLGVKTLTDYFKGPLWKRIKSDKLKKDAACCLCDKQATTVYPSRYDEPTLTGTHDKHLYSMCHTCHGDVQFENGERLGIRESNERFFKQYRKETSV